MAALLCAVMGRPAEIEESLIKEPFINPLVSSDLEPKKSNDPATSVVDPEPGDIVERSAGQPSDRVRRQLEVVSAEDLDLLETFNPLLVETPRAISSRLKRSPEDISFEIEW